MGIEIEYPLGYAGLRGYSISRHRQHWELCWIGLSLMLFASVCLSPGDIVLTLLCFAYAISYLYCFNLALFRFAICQPMFFH